MNIKHLFPLLILIAIQFVNAKTKIFNSYHVIEPGLWQITVFHMQGFVSGNLDKPCLQVTFSEKTI